MKFNKENIEPLINDGFAGEPAKRCVQFIQSKRKEDALVAGVYCSYAPLEIIRALGGVPAVLCAFANKTIEAAEQFLPSNLCPLIKSSYGFIVTDTCPFYSLSDVVIAETTCDGKKKMFELIAGKKPLFVMDLPQLPDEPEALINWAAVIRKTQAFLEKTWGKTATPEQIESEIKQSNKKNRLMNQIFDYAAMNPPVINWQEMYDLTYLAMPAATGDMEQIFSDALRKLEERVSAGVFYGAPSAPRILVTGCPVGGDAAKIFKIIENAGGVIVAPDSCTGMKTFLNDIEENSADPYQALSRRYLEIPCACMSPNDRRLRHLDTMIKRFRPDAVIDVILHACHTYNVESDKIMKHVQNKHGLPFLKIETDYSSGDVEKLRTRVEALLESLKQ
jgi:benzoyl-CoA reductase/2-hydroxyglutaryl-CoA dehydratase subunit BcrC/BadD/HgdB